MEYLYNILSQTRRHYVTSLIIGWQVNIAVGKRIVLWRRESYPLSGLRVHTTKYRQSLVPPFVGRALGLHYMMDDVICQSCMFIIL